MDALTGNLLYSRKTVKQPLPIPINFVLNYILLFSYSRKLIWLEAASTNNCPAVVASFFVEQVACLKGWYFLCSSSS